MSWLTRIGIVSSLLMLLGGVVVLQYVGDRYKVSIPYDGMVTFSPEAYRAFDLGMHSAVASLLWLDTIQNIGGHAFERQTGLAHRISVINALDPYFSYPYAFGALLIPGLVPDETHEALAIGARGVALHLPDWRIPYYTAITYQTKIKDRERAAAYFAATAATPGVPEGIKGTALRLSTIKESDESMYMIWASLYENSNDETVRAFAARMIEQLAAHK